MSSTFLLAILNLHLQFSLFEIVPAKAKASLIKNYHIDGNGLCSTRKWVLLAE